MDRTGGTEPIDLDEIKARYERESELRPDGFTLTEGFPYIHFKAFAYLQFGPERYRENDAFAYPREDWSPERLAAIADGCHQILAWRGMTPDRPLQGLGIRHFYDLLAVFHFQLALQFIAEMRDAAVLDGMRMKHVVSGDEVLLYNLVPTPAQVEGPPCPYCGTSLRTPRAKQCRSCKRSWHDSPGPPPISPA